MTPRGEYHKSADECFEAIKDEWSEFVPEGGTVVFPDGVTVTNHSDSWIRIVIYGPQEEEID